MKLLEIYEEYQSLENNSQRIDFLTELKNNIFISDLFDINYDTIICKLQNKIKPFAFDDINELERE